MADADTIRAGRQYSRQLDEALDDLRHQVAAASEAERQYRLTQGTLILEAPSGTVDQKRAWLNAECADARYLRDLADGLKQAAVETVRSRRTQLSYVQSRLANEREEAALARTGPQ